MSPRIRAGDQLGDEATLANAGFTQQLDRGRPSPIEFTKGAIQFAELLGAPYEVLGEQGHMVRNQDKSGRPNREIRVFP
jgi:hypothetical protein